MKISRFCIFLILHSSLAFSQKPLYSLVVSVKDLRNSEGVVQFSLYNKKDTIPDEKFQKFYQQLSSPITNNKAVATFKHLPKGYYAFNVLHDENADGKIKKGFIFPKEGIGFSRFSSIGIGNKPNFKKARFLLNSNLEIEIKVIYF